MARSLRIDVPMVGTMYSTEESPKIDRKYAAYLIAKALFEGVMSAKFEDYQNARESKYIEESEVDFGIPCVVSAGSDAGVANKILIGVKRVSKLNQQNWVSFEVNHCAGAVKKESQT